LRQLEERGITVLERVPLVVGVGEYNEKYLEAKRDRMGHVLPDDETLSDRVSERQSLERQSSERQSLERQSVAGRSGSAL
jgi:3,4-dihydroxy 2-butanone 4-phosphate synthase/GTP cyclohydrolase II